MAGSAVCEEGRQAHGAGDWDTQGYRGVTDGPRVAGQGSRLHQPGTVRFPSQAGQAALS